MKNAWFDYFAAELAGRDAARLRRFRRQVSGPQTPHVVVDGQPVLAFCSNDYLGFAADPRLSEAFAEAARHHGTGAGATHMVSGHLDAHAELEDRLERFLGRPVLTFANGYLANIGVLPALVGRDDAIFADKLVHASLLDGCQLARATLKRFRHQDLGHLESLLAETPARRRLIVVDGVYSMDGDVAPLPALIALAERFDALLYVDDAHGFGVNGPQGRGSAFAAGIEAHPRLVYLATFGKAAGAQGAAISAEPILIDWLLNTCRSYIYTTAQPPALAAALSKAIDLIEQADDRRAHLQTLIRQFRSGCEGLPWQLADSASAIQPLIVGDAEGALRLADALWRRGIWVPAIRPPTVPEGSARLRITFSAAHGEKAVAQLLSALHQAAGDMA